MVLPTTISLFSFVRGKPRFEMWRLDLGLNLKSKSLWVLDMEAMVILERENG